MLPPEITILQLVQTLSLMFKPEMTILPWVACQCLIWYDEVIMWPYDQVLDFQPENQILIILLSLVPMHDIHYLDERMQIHLSDTRHDLV